MPGPHSVAIAHAIALNDASRLSAALSAAPPHWPTLTHRGFTCWSRVLVSRRRTALLDVLVAHGWSVPPSLVFRGRERTPLGLAIQHGNLAAVNRLLSLGARPPDKEGGVSLLAYAIDRFARPLFRPCIDFDLVLGTHLYALSVEPQLDPWAPLIGRLQEAGADPCPKAMAQWLALSLARPQEPWLAWFEHAWDQGVRPLPCREGSFDIRQAQPALQAFMAFESPVLEPLLEHILRQSRPSPQWIGSFRAFPAMASPPMVERFEKILSVLRRAWPHPLSESDWTNGWEESWRGLSGRINIDCPAKVLLCQWALDNAAPPGLFVSGRHPLFRGVVLQNPQGTDLESVLALARRFLECLPNGLATVSDPVGKKTVGDDWRALPFWSENWAWVESQARAVMAGRLDACLPHPIPLVSRGRL